MTIDGSTMKNFGDVDEERTVFLIQCVAFSSQLISFVWGVGPISFFHTHINLWVFLVTILCML